MRASRITQAVAVLLLAGMFVSCQGEGEPAPVETGLLERLDAAAVHLDTLVPGPPYADLQAIKPFLEGRRIVAMGEATHGTHEFFQMKHRMFSFLVEEMDFHYFGLEAFFQKDAQVVEDYVLTGEGELEEIMKLFYFPWAVEEVRDLLAWMRAYNADETHSEKVHFMAFDPITGTRDPVMAENIKTFLAGQGEDSRIFLWAHNAHVSKKAGWMGSYLKKEFGDEAYLIGFEFYEGQFTSRDNPLSASLRAFEAPPVSEAYYADDLAALNRPYLFFDFQSMGQDERLQSWLASPQRSHSIDEFYYVSHFREDWYTQTDAWAGLYDALIFTRTTTYARPVDSYPFAFEDGQP